jgi:hypothetical protein
MIRLLIPIVLGAGGIACLVLAWFSHDRNTRELNRLGRIYSCERWVNESNHSYHQRLQKRIFSPWRNS